MVNFANEQLLTVTEAAEFLRCSKDAIRKRFKQGLESARFGKRLYTSKEAINRAVSGGGSEEVDAFLKKHGSRTQKRNA